MIYFMQASSGKNMSHSGYNPLHGGGLATGTLKIGITSNPKGQFRCDNEQGDSDEPFVIKVID